jgi:hypothetical protein
MAANKKGCSTGPCRSDSASSVQGKGRDSGWRRSFRKGLRDTCICKLNYSLCIWLQNPEEMAVMTPVSRGLFVEVGGLRLGGLPVSGGWQTSLS